MTLRLQVTLDEVGLRRAVMDLASMIARGALELKNAADRREMETLATLCENRGMTREAARVRSWLLEIG